MNLIKILLFVFAGLIFPSHVFAQFTETKEINKKYAVSPETRIEISNKYGKVELNTWDKDSVTVNIKIRVEEKKLSKLEKLIDQIDFDFTDSQHFLIIRTNVGENMSTLEKEFMKFKETLLQSGSNMQIDYTVWLPATNNLKVENKFGDIFIGDFKSEVEIDLSNGNLKAHDFENRLSLILNFADATINQINSARIECNYSDLYIKKAETLRISSKSSDLEIAELNDLNADSRRDKFRIRRVDLIEATGSFSNFRINELTDRLTMRVEYGDIDIQKTAADFSNFLIESKSTDINLYFDSNSQFGFEITHTKADVELCTQMEIEEKTVLDEKEGKTRLKGNFGTEKNSKTRLFINASSGEVNVFAN